MTLCFQKYSDRRQAHYTHLRRYSSICRLSSFRVIVLVLAMMTGNLAHYPSGALAAGNQAESSAALTLAADTNRPSTSTFIPGETIELTFTVTGITPTITRLFLQIETVNESGYQLNSQFVKVPADQGAVWKYSMPAVNQGLGFYRVNARLSNGVTWPELGSRGAGYLTYAIVVDPAKRTLYPSSETHFGMQGGFNKDANVLPYLGVRWVMDGEFGWHKTEPDHAGQVLEKIKVNTVDGIPYVDKGEKTRWDFCKFMKNGNEQQWHIYKMITGIICVAPRWAQANPVDMGTPQHRYLKQGPLSVDGERDWATYCKHIAAAAMKVHADSKPRYYELTWEPIPPWNFNGTIKDVVRFYEIGYKAIHDVDPDACILGPCAAGISKPEELDDWMKAGIGNHLDGVSAHPYHAHPAEREGLIRHLRQYKSIIRKYVGKDLPVFGTEQGYGHAGSPGDDLAHAQEEIRTKLITFGEGYKVNFAFYAHSGMRHGFDCDYGYYEALTKTAGYGANKLGPRPVAPAFAAMTWLLEGHHPSECIEWLGNSSWGYVFERPESLVLALWDYGSESRTVTIPVGVEQVQAFDWMGRETLLAAPEGMLTLQLGPEPVYIKGVSEQLWGSKSVKAIRPQATSMTVFAGSEIEISGTVTNPQNEMFDGILLLSADAANGIVAQQAEMKLKPGQSADFRFRIPLSSGTALGELPLKLLLVQNRKTIAVASVRLDVTAPIGIKDAIVAMENGTEGIRLIVQERQGEERDGILTVRLEKVPGSQAEKPFHLKKQQENSVFLPLNINDADPFKVYPLQVEAKLRTGYVIDYSKNVNFLFAAKLEENISVNNRTDVIMAQSANLLQGREYVVRAETEYEGMKDSAAKLWFAWDQNAFYLRALVQDDVHLQAYSGDGIWKQDCIQMAVDIDHGTTFSVTGNGFMDSITQARVSELGFALTQNGPQAVRWISPDREQLRFGILEAADLGISVTQTEDGLLYAADIPWKQLGLKTTPKAGTALGIGMTVNDSDNANQRDPSALGIFDLKRRNDFGDLILLP